MKILIRHQAKIFPVLDIALNGANYLFNIYIAWHLAPSDFGIISALLSLLALLLVTGVSLQLYTAKQVAEEMGPDEQVPLVRVAQIRRSAILLTAVVTAVYLLALIPLQGLTRGSYVSLLLVLVVFLLNAFLSVDRGVLQGTRRFIQLNMSFYIEVGVKIAVILWLIRIMPNMESVLIAIIIGMAAALAHARWATRPDPAERPQDKVDRDRHDMSRIARIYIATFFIYFFTSVDLILVNYFLPDESGYFAVVLKYTQIMLFVTLSVMTVFIPLLSSAKSDPALFKRRIIMLLGIVFALIASVTLVYWAVAGPTVDFFFGVQYAPAKQYILLDCLPYALLILNFLVINLHVIFDNSRYLYVLTGSAVLLVAMLVMFNSSLTTMLYIETAVFAVMLVAQLLLLRNEIRFMPPAQPLTDVQPAMEES